MTLPLKDIPQFGVRQHTHRVFARIRPVNHDIVETVSITTAFQQLQHADQMIEHWQAVRSRAFRVIAKHRTENAKQVLRAGRVA